MGGVRKGARTGGHEERKGSQVHDAGEVSGKPVSPHLQHQGSPAPHARRSPAKDHVVREPVPTLENGTTVDTTKQFGTAEDVLAAGGLKVKKKAGGDTTEVTRKEGAPLAGRAQVRAEDRAISKEDVRDDAKTGVYEVVPVTDDLIVDMEPVRINLDTVVPEGRTFVMVRMGERTVVLDRNGGDSKIYLGSAEGVRVATGPDSYTAIDSGQLNKGWYPLGDGKELIGAELMIDGTVYSIH